MRDLTAEDRALLVDNVARWRVSPADFVREQFAAEPDPSQSEALRYVGSVAPADRFVATQSCAGTGKTTTLAWASIWFMCVWGDSERDPQGSVVSITRDNLRKGYVKEAALWRARSRLASHLLDINDARMALRGREQTGFISFDSFPKDADAETIGKTLSGLHGRYVFQGFDECGDMPPALARMSSQAQDVDQVYFKTMATGNPLSTSGMLHEITTTLRDQWRLIVVTGDPDDPQRSPRVPLDKARRAIETYGRDNAWVRIYILGQFPLTALNKFLGPDDIARAQRRNYGQPDIEWSQNRLGIDPARFGDDRTGFVRRQGVVMWGSSHMRGASSTEIAARAAEMHATAGVGPFDLVLVDAGGPNSGGVVDALGQAGLRVMEISSASTNPPEPRFYNLRAYMHWQAAEWVKTRGQLPKDEPMANEALAGQYDFKAGRLIVESKDDIKERLGASPDLWDAACLTFAVPDAPKDIGLPGDHAMARARRGRRVRAVMDE